MISFVKMQGIGNDFVVIDAFKDSVVLDEPLPKLARRLNDRRFGVGGDGLLILEPGGNAAFRMRMFNPDGSESEMCGNGVRCVAKLIHDRGYTRDSEITLETGAGILRLQILPKCQIRVNMGPARLTRAEIGMVGPAQSVFVDSPICDGLVGTAVSMGNPHLVVFVQDVSSVDLERTGPKLEHHELFPNRVNVHFVQAEARDSLIQRTWERGAGATLACGTGACAVAVAGFVTGRSERNVTVQLPGGSLHIEYAEDGTVFMTGPAQTVFEGEINPQVA